MRTADTNVLVRIISRDNAQQTASAELFISRGAWVPTLVLAEAIWVLGNTYKLRATTLIDVLELLISNQDLVLQDSEVVRAALDLFRSNPGLGFSECLILESTRKAGHLPLGTFDRRLAKIEGTQSL